MANTGRATCPNCGSMDDIKVRHRNCNHSAFNGYRRTWSAYSEVACTGCHHRWRTRAAYVSLLPDLSAEEDWANA